MSEVVAIDGELALFGGRPVIEDDLPTYPSMGKAEVEAVRRVVESGVLSAFHGSPGPWFLGGAVVREFEAAWSDRFGVRHSISMNSATSGLVAAMGAIGISPGDEVIVPPYTMSATAVAPLAYGGVPVFADVEADQFCIDVDAVRAAITPRTKAIIAVDLFGHPARLRELRQLADERGLHLVEDAAQAPLAAEDGRYAGTVGHIGVFSLNFHKHIHTGEGGMCVTNDDALAERLQLVRNHGENIVDDGDLGDVYGFNFRMTELSAAVGVEQLKRIDAHVEHRIAAAERLTEAVGDLEGLTPPVARDGCRHVYVGWAAKVDPDVLGVGRERFCAALAAEGLPVGAGYVRPLYRLPLFQRRGYPADLCPVVERLHERELITVEISGFDFSGGLVERFAAAIRRVHAKRGALPDPHS